MCQGEIGKNIVKDMLRDVASPKPDRESEIADDPLSPAGWALLTSGCEIETTGHAKDVPTCSNHKEPRGLERVGVFVPTCQALRLQVWWMI